MSRAKVAGCAALLAPAAAVTASLTHRPVSLVAALLAVVLGFIGIGALVFGSPPPAVLRPRYADLTEFAERPDVWMLSPPCGYDWWTLYRPGAERDEHGFMTAEPTARFSAREGPGYAPPWGPHLDLDDIRAWAVPWIEQVSGGVVVDIREGVGPPYGPDRDLYEYAVCAQVAVSTT